MIELRARGVELWQEDGSLRYRAGPGVLAPTDLDRLKLAKQTILNELALEGPLGCGCALCQDPAFFGEG